MMRNNGIRIVLAIALTFLGCFANTSVEENMSQDELGSNDSLRTILDTYFSALTSLKKFNGVISVKQADKLVLHKAYNIEPDPTNSLHVDAESQFDIHSVSKLMARYQLAVMERDGEQDPNSALSAYLPDFRRADDITVRMLMEHRSGLPRELSNKPGKMIDQDMSAVLALAANEKLIFEPGTDQQYSNIGYSILYYVIGKQGEMSYSQALIDELFVPLGMASSGGHFDNDRKNIRGLAKNHELEDTAFVQIPNVLDDESRLSRIYSTASDLHRFLDHVRADSLGNLLADDKGIIQQSGGSDGIRAHVYLDRNSDKSYVLLCNIDAIPFEETLRDIERMLNKQPVEIPRAIHREAVEVAPEVLGKYVGSYSFRDMDELQLKIKLEEGELVIYQDGEAIAELAGENDSIFFADPTDPGSFEFKQNENGTYHVMMGWRGVKLKGVPENKQD